MLNKNIGIEYHLPHLTMIYTMQVNLVITECKTLFFLKGYKKQLRKIFEQAGYYIPQEEKKLLSEQAVQREEEEKKEENGQFDTLLKCTEVNYLQFVYKPLRIRLL